MKKWALIFLLSFSCIYIISCNGDDDMDDDDMMMTNDTTYTQTPYEFDIPEGFPQPVIPTDNPVTQEGVQLGRMLFYDPILSGDSTMSCATCHRQENAFATNNIVEFGIDGIAGTRNSMPLFNLAYGLNPLFTWDGARNTLEEQATEPIANPIELHQSLEEAVARLEAHEDYPLLFRKAFNADPSEEYIAKAMSQFMRTMVSANSKYDKAITNGSGVFFDEQEIKGRDLFFLETGMNGEVECIHCHGGRLFTEFTFKNNGLDDVTDISQFTDPGLGGVTGLDQDYGLFKVPSLRNIALTAPYMHDGRFATLEEVIDHYSEGIHYSPTISTELGSVHTTGENINLTPEQKADILKFLHTLTDTTFINDPQFSNPFE